MVYQSLLRPNKYSNKGHLIKIEWFVTNVTFVGSSDRDEYDNFGGGFGCFFVNLGHFCDWGANFDARTPS